jgi:hypothetical protein
MLCSLVFTRAEPLGQVTSTMAIITMSTVESAKKDSDDVITHNIEDSNISSAHCKSWARLIKKLYTKQIR